MVWVPGEANVEIEALRQGLLHIIRASDKSVINGIRIILIDFKRDINQVESSGAEDGSTVLELVNAEVFVAGGGSQRMPVLTHRCGAWQL